MYMNLHALPHGTAQYTALVGDGEDFDEIDFVAGRYLSTEQLIIAVGTSEAAEDYVGLSVVGLIDQSAGEVIFE